MQINEFKKVFSKELGGIYSQEETQTILDYILIDAFGISKLTILSQPQLELAKNQAEKVVSFLADLKKGIPVQHLLGVGHFYGLMLKVTPDVLIPRQETEELVDLIIKENKGKKLKILDVCTGSGCIALALKKNLPECEVTAIELSEKALIVAKENMATLGLQVNFKKADALKLEEELAGESYDIIVANPPYIPVSDKDNVQKNVWMYEPHTALFVPDEKPLLFYESIAGFAKKTKPVTLYFEINEDLGHDLTELLNKLSFKEIDLKRDLNGKNRMLKCQI